MDQVPGPSGVKWDFGKLVHGDEGGGIMRTADGVILPLRHSNWSPIPSVSGGSGTSEGEQDDNKDQSISEMKSKSSNRQEDDCDSSTGSSPVVTVASSQPYLMEKPEEKVRISLRHDFLKGRQVLKSSTSTTNPAPAPSPPPKKMLMSGTHRKLIQIENRVLASLFGGAGNDDGEDLEEMEDELEEEEQEIDDDEEEEEQVEQEPETSPGQDYDYDDQGAAFWEESPPEVDQKEAESSSDDELLPGWEEDYISTDVETDSSSSAEDETEKGRSGEE